MQTVTANEFETPFRKCLDQAQRSPVGVLRYGRLVGVMVSAQDVHAMRGFYTERLLRTMDGTALAARRAGLKPETLVTLLAYES